MIHHKDFPFDEREEEAEIVHLAPGTKHHTNGYTRVIVILIFLALIGLSIKALYDLGRGEDDTGIRIIEANPEPYKVRPENPGGMQILHADKEIYEHLKMPLEEPIDMFPEREDSIGKLLEAEARRQGIPQKISDLAEPSLKTAPSSGSQVNIPQIMRGKKPEPKVITIGSDGKPVVAPSNSINYKKTEPSLTGIKKVEVDKVLARQSAPEVWLQLGTYKSEQEATRAWQDVKEKNSDILNKVGIKVTKSDMGPQGTVYRLQAGPADNETAAKEMCSKLNDRRLSCFYTTSKPTTSQ